MGAILAYSSQNRLEYWESDIEYEGIAGYYSQAGQLGSSPYREICR